MSFGPLNILVETGYSKLVLLRIKPVSGLATVTPFTDGARLDVEVHTTSGRDYPQTVILTVSG